jgi:hypothetical protein
VYVSIYRCLYETTEKLVSKTSKVGGKSRNQEASKLILVHDRDMVDLQVDPLQTRINESLGKAKHSYGYPRQPATCG